MGVLTGTRKFTVVMFLSLLRVTLWQKDHCIILLARHWPPSVRSTVAHSILSPQQLPLTSTASGQCLPSVCNKIPSLPEHNSNADSFPTSSTLTLPRSGLRPCVCAVMFCRAMTERQTLHPRAVTSSGDTRRARAH